MRNAEKHRGEGRLEKLARLSVVEGLGMAALAAAGALVLPPAGAVIAANVAAAELVSVPIYKEIQQHFKKRRLEKEKKQAKR